MPAIAQAKAANVPIIAYDVPVDSPDVTFVSFDNVAVGREMAKAWSRSRTAAIGR